jgi:hypothetical protein
MHTTSLHSPPPNFIHRWLWLMIMNYDPSSPYPLFLYSTRLSYWFFSSSVWSSVCRLIYCRYWRPLFYFDAILDQFEAGTPHFLRPFDEMINDFFSSISSPSLASKSWNGMGKSYWLLSHSLSLTLICSTPQRYYCVLRPTHQITRIIYQSLPLGFLSSNM